MIEVRQTEVFSKWLAKLSDKSAKARIVERLNQLGQGHFGDVRPVGEGIGELRVHAGPGYRLYFAQRGDVFILLLCGGIKDTQQRDIRTAKMMARTLKEDIRGN